MAYIYKITNMVNGKSYIGKTERSIQERFREHKKLRNNRKHEKRPLYTAMNKYGVKNFKLELLEKTDIPEEREEYYIKYFNSYGSTGYNATIGGDGKAWLDHQAIIECYEKEQNATKVAEIMKCDRGTVNTILKNNNITRSQSGDHMKIKFSIKVNQYNLNGEYIQTFNSYADAGRWIQKNKFSQDKRYERIAGKIAACCNNERKTAYKFKWKKQGTVAESG